MNSNSVSVMTVFSGWDGYNTSLVHAVTPLSRDNLRYRPAPGRRSAGEIAAHIAFGRLDWFHRMSAPGSAELVAQTAPVWQPWQQVDESVADDAAQIARWLNAGWQMIEACLNQWTVADLGQTYLQSYGGKTYAVSRQ